MGSQTKISRSHVSFGQYKAIKDEIVRISEMRYENILTKQLTKFKKEFKTELMPELNVRFDAIDSKFDVIDSRFNVIDSKFAAIDQRFNAFDSHMSSLEKRMTFLTWFLPILMTVLLTIFKLI